MKKSHVFIWLFALIFFKAFSQNDTLLSEPIFCNDGNWKLVFEDEFNSGTLNTDEWLTWFPYTDDGGDSCTFCRTHGNEGQVFFDENIVFSDSSLKIIARRDSAYWMGEEREYTSGMIHSRRVFGQGRYEVRAKLPDGMGFWPAIWAYGYIYTEIDIMEAGMQHPRRYHTTVHNWKMGSMQHNRKNARTNLSADFHTYAMEWEPNIIRFYLDDREVWTMSRFTSRRGRNLKRCDLKPGRYGINPIFPHQNERVSLIINLSLGNSNTPFTKSPNEKTRFPAEMEVDWVRFYERE